MQLNGKQVALFIAPEGTEEAEFTAPKQALEAAGARVVVVGAARGAVRTVKNDLEPAGRHEVDLTFAEANADDFDGLVIPGGTVGADKIRAESDAVSFVQRMTEQGKPIAAICHGPWVLAEADVVRGRTVTSYASLRTDLRNAGAVWVDQEVAVDNGLVTSRTPADLEAFCAKVIEEIAEGEHSRP